MAYVDTSVLVACYCAETLSPKADRAVRELAPPAISPLVEVEFHSAVALKGNVDCAHTLTFGSEEKVVAQTKEVIRKAAAGGGLILSSSNSIHSGVKPGNYLAMWNAIRMYGKYPIQLESWTGSGAAEAF